MIRRLVTRQQSAPSFASISLAVCLGLSGGFWSLEAVTSPQVVHAYTARVDVALDNRPGESFETLMQRADVAARAATQRSFDRDILATSAFVIVTAQNQGLTVPVLSLEVTRTQWRSQPDVRRWATYFPVARALLGLGGFASGSGSAVTPTAVPAPQPPAPTQPSSTPPSTNPSAPGTPPATNPPPTSGTPGAAPAPGTAVPGSSPTPGNSTAPASPTPGGSTAIPGGTAPTSTPAPGATVP